MTATIRLKVKCSRCGRLRGALWSVGGRRFWEKPEHRPTLTRQHLKRLGLDGPRTVGSMGRPIDSTAVRSEDGGTATAIPVSWDVDLVQCRCAPPVTVPRADLDKWLGGSRRVIQLDPDAYR